MPVYIALLRAVNVGGRNTLSMADLKSICTAEGFTQVETYIASGNVIFNARLSPAKTRAVLEKRLHDYAGRPLGVVVRTREELAAALEANPFPTAPAKFTVAVFLNEPPPSGALQQVRGRTDEDLRLGAREIYITYPNGMGRSKLKVPAAEQGTARNLNTVAALVGIAARRP